MADEFVLSTLFFDRSLDLCNWVQNAPTLHPNFVSFNDMSDDSPLETFSDTVASLNGYGLGYLHVVETAQNSKGSSKQESPCHPI